MIQLKLSLCFKWVSWYFRVVFCGTASWHSTCLVSCVTFALEFLGLGRSSAVSWEECCKCVFLLEGKECRLLGLLCSEHVWDGSGAACLGLLPGADACCAPEFNFTDAAPGLSLQLHPWQVSMDLLRAHSSRCLPWLYSEWQHTHRFYFSNFSVLSDTVLIFVWVNIVVILKIHTCKKYFVPP